MIDAVGYDMRMTIRSRDTIHRALAGLLVAAILAGVAPALSANEMVCKMDRHASALQPSCGACGPTSEAETGPSLKAASCCRFEAPSETQALPATITSTLLAFPGLDAQGAALAIASDFPNVAATCNSVGPAAGAPATSPSFTRSSILRL